MLGWKRKTSSSHKGDTKHHSKDERGCSCFLKCHPHKEERSVHSPSRYASILDLLHKDPELPFLLAPQANYTKTKAAPLWLEQLQCDNSMHTSYKTKLPSANWLLCEDQLSSPCHQQLDTSPYHQPKSYCTLSMSHKNLTLHKVPQKWNAVSLHIVMPFSTYWTSQARYTHTHQC